MRILFHVGVGNLDRPFRWQFVNQIFSDLARTLESLGHRCLLWNHPQAPNIRIYRRHITSKLVKGEGLKISRAFHPDWVFTWNGSNEGDKLIKKEFGLDRMVYAELGFFNHYKTLYFDFMGVNGDSENLTEELLPFDAELYDKIKKQYIKPPLYAGSFTFVPLQDESDTNITMYSPIKKMDDLLQYVEDTYSPKENMKVLFKQHPMAKSRITPRENFIEVTEGVHHYLPYASKVIGVNSNTLLESLIYHDNVVSLGKGITSRSLTGDEHKQYVTHLFKKQFNMSDMTNIELIKVSRFYKTLVRKGR